MLFVVDFVVIFQNLQLNIEDMSSLCPTLSCPEMFREPQPGRCCPVCLRRLIEEGEGAGGGRGGRESGRRERGEGEGGGSGWREREEGEGVSLSLVAAVLCASVC